MCLCVCEWFRMAYGIPAIHRSDRMLNRCWAAGVSRVSRLPLMRESVKICHATRKHALQ